MSIANNIKPNSEALVRWVEFKNGISFQLKFVARATVQAITEQNTELRFDPRQKTRMPRINPEGLTADFVEAGVLNWKGVTPNSLAEIIPLDIAAYPAEERDKELPYNKEDCVAVVRAAYELDSFLQENCTDIAVFRSKQESEVKN